MLRWVSKLLATFVCFILPMICTVLPYAFSGGCCSAERHSRQKVLLSRLMCLGGGIFFGTYLLHMVPDVRNILDQGLIIPHKINYPIGELLIGIGFFIVLFVESTVAYCNDRHSASHSTASELTVTAEKNVVADDGIQDGGNQDGGGAMHNDDMLNNCEKAGDHRAPVPNGHAAGGHGHIHVHVQSSRSLALVLALSLHRIFEGMSIGLQQSASGVGSLLLAVMCHETVIGFSLGLQFVRANLPKNKLLITCLVCSVVMPIGVVIGMVMSETNTGGSSQLTPGPMMIAVGALQAIAVGTFIYVTFFEILSEELSSQESSLSKVMFVALGFTLMAVLDLVPEEQLQLHSTQPVLDQLLTSNLTTTPVQ